MGPRENRKNGCSDSVLFLGNREDVARLYQAMDVFVLPSRYEGLGMVAVEAQAASVQVIASTELPEEVEMTPYIRLMPLQEGAEQWASAAMAMRGTKRGSQENLRQYDISAQSGTLIDYYEACLNELAERSGKRR